jgi:hypothetical protein
MNRGAAPAGSAAITADIVEPVKAYPGHGRRRITAIGGRTGERLGPRHRGLARGLRSS